MSSKLPVSSPLWIPVWKVALSSALNRNTGYIAYHVLRKGLCQNKKIAIIPPVPHCLFPSLFVVFPTLFCPLCISSTGMNQIWKLFQLKSISHHVFLFVEGFLLGWMHIKIQSKKKLTRLFTSLLTRIAIPLFWSKGTTLLSKTSKRTARKYQGDIKNLEHVYTYFCLLSSLKFTSLCSSSLSRKAGVCSISSQAHWCELLFTNSEKPARLEEKTEKPPQRLLGCNRVTRSWNLYQMSQTALIFYFTIWCEGQSFEGFPKHGRGTPRMSLWSSGGRTQAEGHNSKAASHNVQV